MRTGTLFLCVFFLLPTMLFAQTITSTTTGGSWHAETTWIGGAVPGQDNDVVIDGTVYINRNTRCNNLTINTGKTLHNESGIPDLQVRGSFVNNGTVTDGSTGYIDFYLAGDLVNNGEISCEYFSFNGGSNTQTISGSSSFGPSNAYVNPSGILTAVSDFAINDNCFFDLGGDAIEMQSFTLTVNSKEGSYLSNGIIRSNGNVDITGPFRCNTDGSPTLTGSGVLEIVSNIYSDGHITIAQNKVIKNYGTSIPDWYIRGDVINYGTIQDNEAGGYIDLYITGHCQNEGSIICEYLTFNAGTGTQTFSGGAAYGPGHVYINPSVRITATSEIKVANTTKWDLSGDTLAMGSHRLEIRSEADKHFSGGYIESYGEINIGGQFNSNIMGSPMVTSPDSIFLNSNTYWLGDLTLAAGAVLVNNNVNIPDLTVQGSITNNGVITNNPRGGYIDLYVNGTITNEGELENSYLTMQCFEGTTPTLAGSATYSTDWLYVNPSGRIYAANDLTFFNSHVELGGDTLVMNDYGLTITSPGDRYFTSGLVESNGELRINGSFKANLTGDFLLTGADTTFLRGNVYVYDNLYIDEQAVIANYGTSIPDLHVYGDVYNAGTITDNPPGGYIDFYAYGSFYNAGQFDPEYLTVRPNKNGAEIEGTVASQIYLRAPEDENISPAAVTTFFTNERHTNVSAINVAPGGHLNMLSGYGSVQNVNNNGAVTITQDWTGGAYRLDFDSPMQFDIYVRDKGSIEHSTMTVYDNQTHPVMTSSVRRWWRWENTGEVGGYYMTFKYDDALLNGQDEDKLDVFVSPDHGETWEKVSTPVNTVRDTENNTVTIGTYNEPVTSSFGDFILSSGDLVDLPSISLSITGRSQIRVGPPNRYTITYWNNNNTPTGDFVLDLQTFDRVWFDGIVTTDIETGEKVELPLDSLTYDGVDDQLFLLVQGLEGKEVRSFDVILFAYPDERGIEQTEFAFTFTAAALWIGGTLLEDYVSNVVVEGCYEMWRPVRHDQSLMDASTTALKNSMKKAATIENGAKGLAKKGAEEIVKKTGKAVLWPAFLAKDIYDCLGNTFKGMKDYVNGNFDKQGKKMEKITSWDPNEKQGPTGYGDNGYMATAAPMNYTILFENKKEATAPAYKIVIVDTLDESVYDIESVEVGEMSHDMGTFTQEGNILTWEFIEIELPPNATPPEGEGFVKFTVNPKPGLPTGTRIENRATIVFDFNAPIMTNTFVNTLDFDPPTTNGIAVTQVPNELVEVRWNGNDTGSGVQKSMVYMANGEGPFTLAGISDSSSIRLPIQREQRYRFYVLSQDQVGNKELEPAEYGDIITSVTAEEEAVVPDEFALGQNFPNPFNPTTTIQFALPSDAFVSLEIFNVLGEKIYTVLDEHRSAGIHQVMVNLSRFPSGVYFYRIDAGEFIQTKKLMLLK